jgi:hypothetical protein
MPAPLQHPSNTVHLYPTKSRLSLLREVKAGDVYEPDWAPRTFRSDDRNVTERIRELMRGGLVSLEPAATDGVLRWARLTDRGHAYLMRPDDYRNV